MQPSRVCGAEDSSCTQRPQESPIRASMRIRKVLSFVFESIVRPFPVGSPASLLPAAVLEPQLQLRARVLKSDQGA